MTCRELNEFLMEYLDGELPAAARAEFDEHLAVCEPCVRYLESYRATVRLARACNGDDHHPHGVPDELIRAILDVKKGVG
jgi:anti-sigma factor RsiW